MQIQWLCGGNGSPRLWGNDRRGSNRVNRGGRWNNNGNNCRSANRNNNNPTNTNNNIGFRLARSSRSQFAYVQGCARRAQVMTRPLSCSGQSPGKTPNRAARVGRFAEDERRAQEVFPFKVNTGAIRIYVRQGHRDSWHGGQQFPKELRQGCQRATDCAGKW